MYMGVGQNFAANTSPDKISPFIISRGQNLAQIKSHEDRISREQDLMQYALRVGNI